MSEIDNEILEKAAQLKEKLEDEFEAYQEERENEERYGEEPIYKGEPEDVLSAAMGVAVRAAAVLFIEDLVLNYGVHNKPDHSLDVLMKDRILDTLLRTEDALSWIADTYFNDNELTSKNFDVYKTGDMQQLFFRSIFRIEEHERVVLENNAKLEKAKPETERD